MFIHITPPAYSISHYATSQASVFLKNFKNKYGIAGGRLSNSCVCYFIAHEHFLMASIFGKTVRSVKESFVGRCCNVYKSDTAFLRKARKLWLIFLTAYDILCPQRLEIDVSALLPAGCSAENRPDKAGWRRQRAASSADSMDNAE